MSKKSIIPVDKAIRLGVKDQIAFFIIYRLLLNCSFPTPLSNVCSINIRKEEKITINNH
jgi:hypothetical protein